MSKLVRRLLAFVATLVVLVGMPDLANAQTGSDGTSSTTTEKRVGGVVSPVSSRTIFRSSSLSDASLWTSRTAERIAILERIGHHNTTWHGTIATDPRHNFREITVADLKAMFGSKVCTTSRVTEGLPGLNNEMRKAKIITPARQAAFLATVAYESCFDYALEEAGVTAYYKGRGYMQLTGSYNYSAAGRYLGVNLAGNPTLARSRTWSAPIAGWYWTVHRPGSNAAADNFDMGLVSRYVGYRASSTADAQRCAAFKNAYRYLSGKTAPASTVCYRH
ncbi:glycoside hydrolase family 19 protein [Aestuariimicrobium ganziense]|uniref:glycoside hydrolase family 19 protein n=1 Tax=Aestuariimicrobium ganziense TaxID=2773677 RepID=UPI001943F566|nr:glycoside hydrolase family 19 protein [Aestuariimicrobium ganziense]